jgi:hypothetical protein
VRSFLLVTATLLAACQPGSETAPSARAETTAPPSAAVAPAATGPAAAMPSAAQEGADPFVVVRATRRGGSAEGVAWWLRDMDVRPTGAVVSGVSMAALNAHRGRGKAPWCAANAMSRRSFTADSAEVRGEIDQSMADTAAADFDIHGANITGSGPQDAVVGAFRTCDGQVGAFLLITDRENRPNVVQLEEWPDWKGLIRLQERDDGLFVSSCFECDAEQRINLPEGAFPDRYRSDR